MKKTTLIGLLLICRLGGAAESPPNEENIYYHLHQATRWAKLSQGSSCYFAMSELKKHLGEIKFNEVRLVDSQFYQEYLLLGRLAFRPPNEDFKRLNLLSLKIQKKAIKLKIQLPSGAKDEFLLCPHPS